ncbi:MAG: hypothetical protein U0791_23280 [Gemmataceae bacterium]
MTPKQAALARLESAIATWGDDPKHAHGSQGLSRVAAQDVVMVGEGLADAQCEALCKGAKGALEGLAADAEPLIVLQKTWQVRHLIETAKAKIGVFNGPQPQ